MRVKFSATISKQDKGWTLSTVRENRKKKGEAKGGSFGLSTLTEVKNFVDQEFRRHLEAEKNHA